MLFVVVAPQGGSEMLQCPRCQATVPAHPGVCATCGENVYQCHKCRLEKATNSVTLHITHFVQEFKVKDLHVGEFLVYQGVGYWGSFY